MQDDEEKAQRLFDKVKPFLSETIQIHSPNPAEEGMWQLKELNNRLRYCRYQSGQYFHRHLDGVHYRSATVQSKLTFMLYTNSASEFEGGRTLFYQSKEATEIWASYLPQQGDLIVFNHNIWHEGEQLEAGEKFVLRSDILYQRTNEPDLPEKHLLANYQEGHLGYIWKLLLFDPQTLLSAGRDTTIKVWNTNGGCSQRLSVHQHSILCLTKLKHLSFRLPGSVYTSLATEIEYVCFTARNQDSLRSGIIPLRPG